MVDLLRRLFQGRKILLLGFGREGQSSYRVLRDLFPSQRLAVADRNPEVAADPLLAGDGNLDLICGEHYLDSLNSFDQVLRSPGIPLRNLKVQVDPSRITSQTDLFLQACAQQVIGVTGTKGKSTTSSLIAHILSSAGTDTVLLGNIGTPAWHFIDRIGPATWIVNELSSHQLEYIRRGPHIAILLNIFEEHLDAYNSFRDYQLAKMKIAETQQPGDFFLYNADDPLVMENIRLLCPSADQQQSTRSFTHSPIHRLTGPPIPRLIPLSLKLRDQLPPVPHNHYLRGEHNRRNILAAVTVCRLVGIPEEAILDGIASFKGLAHRTEDLGIHHGIRWVNDSIATIPEACMAALQSLPGVDTLILGGFDRGISYDGLARFLLGVPVRNLILAGVAGRRIGTELDHLDPAIKTKKKLFYINRFDEFLPLALEHTRPGATCLLSPAAASYDEFRSFEERGLRFRALVTGERRKT